MGNPNASAKPKIHLNFTQTSVRINNNYLENLKGFPEALEAINIQPNKLTFLDLSWNMLAKIPAELLQYPSLKALYLHGNKIEKIPQVDKLKKLPLPRSFTSNGNPIKCVPNYRVYV